MTNRSGPCGRVRRGRRRPPHERSGRSGAPAPPDEQFLASAIVCMYGLVRGRRGAAGEGAAGCDLGAMDSHRRRRRRDGGLAPRLVLPRVRRARAAGGHPRRALRRAPRARARRGSTCATRRAARSRSRARARPSSSRRGRLRRRGGGGGHRRGARGGGAGGAQRVRSLARDRFDGQCGAGEAARTSTLHRVRAASAILGLMTACVAEGDAPPRVSASSCRPSTPTWPGPRGARRAAPSPPTSAVPALRARARAPTSRDPRRASTARPRRASPPCRGRRAPSAQIGRDVAARPPLALPRPREPSSAATRARSPA